MRISISFSFLLYSILHKTLCLCQVLPNLELILICVQNRSLEKVKMKRAIFFVSFISVFFIPAMPDYPQENSNAHPSSRSFLSSLIKGRQESAIPRVSSRTRIIGGNEAQPHQFPYQVSIQVRNYFEGYDHLCGGVIYDEMHVLTAAHCLMGYHHRNLKIIAAEHVLFNDEGSEQYRDVASYHYHPGFIRDILLNDIGIITLDHPLDLNDKIQPLRLPNVPIEYSELARSSGWGDTGYNEGQNPLLMYVDLMHFPFDNCTRLYEEAAFIGEGMLCYGDAAGGKGGCNGDSGGPLVCKVSNGTEYLCGLVSWGMVPCGLAEYPTVFTDTNLYLNWLHGLLPPQEYFEKMKNE